ncbi:MAG: BatD family protein [Prevotella sp.]|nr:BatD family protein [Prevotella sp.]
MLRKIGFIIGFLTLMLTEANAQTVQVEQTLDSINGIFIGQQAHITVGVTADEGAKIVFPQWKPQTYLVPGVELLAIDGDTVSADGGKTTIKRRLTITSFDENLYPIPPVEVKVGGKTFKGNQLALKVITVDVDTVHPNQFFPPKDVQNNPFLWSEWRTPFLLSLLFVALILLALWLYHRLKANKPIITSIRIIKKILPHQRAMKAIDQIKAEHMTASEDQKEYYTRLTDTLREYIRERFGFNAMEMTTPEIIYNLQQSGDKTMISELKDLFETADLVKFAKYSTLMGENDMNLVNAINFIDQTKLEGQPTEERIVPQLTEGDKRTRKNRLTIKALLWTIGVVATALLVYVIYSVVQLL